ncbi:MAG: tetratricopeptide repeat protein [Nitrospirae bacterium]|nr:tetratricopeptide repeat protein [Nitrospirota bacterium]
MNYRWKLLSILALILLGLIIYSNTYNAPFAFDDERIIVSNLKIRDFSIFKDIHSRRYLGDISFAINYFAGRLQPWHFHMTNIFIHIISSLLVGLIVGKTLQTYRFIGRYRDSSIFFISFASSLIFLTHPIQTQAVTYISQRYTSLSTMFYLLSLLLYIKARTENKIAPYILSIISAIAAMKTKEIAFTLPFAIALFELLFLRAGYQERLKYLIPFSFTLLIIPLSLLNVSQDIGNLIGDIEEASREAKHISRTSYLLTQFNVIVTYIRLLFLPINQNLDYDYPMYHSLFDPPVFLSFLFLLLIFAFAFYLLYRSRFMVHSLRSSDSRLTPHASRLTAFGIFWFFLALSVESSIIPIRDVIMEHRLYLPAFGFSILVAAFLQDVFSDRKIKIFLLSAIILALSTSTYTRNEVWGSEISLWQDTVRKSPYKARPHTNLGVSYFEDGQTDLAFSEFKRAIEINPRDANTHNNLGAIYELRGELEKAMESYKTALDINPRLAAAYNGMGVIYMRKGQYEEAIEHFNKAIKLKPAMVKAYNNLGKAYRAIGKMDKSFGALQKGLSIDPDKYPELYSSLALNYRLKGDYEMAITYYLKSISLRPRSNAPYIGTANLFIEMKRPDAVIDLFQRMERQFGKRAVIYFCLGMAYQAKGLKEDARKAYLKAYELEPGNKEFRDKLYSLKAN